jgi:dTDP-glucose 4,6-dehydratase
VRTLVLQSGALVIDVDALTYAGNLDSLRDVMDHPRHRFEHVDIRDRASVRSLFESAAPTAVLHLAAESHVDRSIDAPATFVETNVLGTFNLLEEALRHRDRLPLGERDAFRFLHVSTDEVFGSLGATGDFDELTPYAPSSPYSATKAASDHLVRAWGRTFGLPIVITNCSNNYGPYQFPEKLVPLVTLNALDGKPLPVYGTGENVRDWLHVDDHVSALLEVLRAGRVEETYLIGGRSERRNVDVVAMIADLVDEMFAPLPSGPRRGLIELVPDRPGHDVRYAIDPTKVERELGWAPARTFEAGLEETVRWYLDNEWWWQRIRAGEYRGERLGLRPGGLG